MPCEHESFACEVDVNRLPSVDGGPVKRYSADVRIMCQVCGVKFRFIGLPAGLDLNGATVSVDATEARLAIAPKGEVIPALEDGAVHGFSIRRSG